MVAASASVPMFSTYQDGGGGGGSDNHDGEPDGTFVEGSQDGVSSVSSTTGVRSRARVMAQQREIQVSLYHMISCRGYIVTRLGFVICGSKDGVLRGSWREVRVRVCVLACLPSGRKENKGRDT